MDLKKSVEIIIDSKIVDKIIYSIMFLISVGLVIASHYNNEFFLVILGILSVPIVVLVLTKLLRHMICNPKSNRLIYKISKAILLIMILLLVFVEILIIHVTIIKFFM